MRHVLFTLLIALPFSASATNKAKQCDDLFLLSDGDHLVEPGLVIPASEGIPAHCQVNGVIDGTIRFQVSMPLEGWSGRMMHHAPGGLAGVIGDTTSLLDQGYAASTTDAANPVENNHTFYRDDERKINFAFRANHLTTVLAKRIIGTFYGKDVEYSYLWGCSNGGRAALMEALRYPDDFDGIIAGDPAIDYGTGLLLFSLEGSRVQRENPLTADSVALLDANTKRACDMIDGVADGIIGDPRKCTLEKLNLGALACENGPAADCLTEGQIKTATFFYTGIKDETGNVIVPGNYPGSETGGDFELWVTGNPSFMPLSANDLTATVIESVMHRTPGFSLDKFDPVADYDALDQIMHAVDIPEPDFSAFHDSGGKLIIYNGWNDHPCRAKVLEEFHFEAEALTGKNKTDEMMRTFMVPGMVHCIGGPGAWAADYLSAIVDWVENDKAPDRIIAEHPGSMTFLETQIVLGGKALNWKEVLMDAHNANPDARHFSRPLCPYPQYAQYMGSGSTDDAANFACVSD